MDYPKNYPKAPAGSPLDVVYRAMVEAGCEYATGQDWACPAHEDDRASLGIFAGKKQPVVMYCLAGCSTPRILKALGLTWGAIMKNAPAKPEAEEDPDDDDELLGTETYHYVDENGVGVFDVKRFNFASGKKTFKQRKAGKGTGGVKGVRKVLYRLPEVLAEAKRGGHVYVVEGEKSVHRLESLGCVATTCAGGARAAWLEEYSAALVGAALVTVVADNDPAGFSHALVVARALRKVEIAVSVVMSETDGKGDDVVDHLDAGNALDALVKVKASTLRKLAASLNDGENENESGGNESGGNGDLSSGGSGAKSARGSSGRGRKQTSPAGAKGSGASRARKARAGRDGVVGAVSSARGGDGVGLDVWPSPQEPWSCAERYVRQCHTVGELEAVSGEKTDVRMIRRWRGDFYVHGGKAYRAWSEEKLKAELYPLLERAKFVSEEKQLRWKPDMPKLTKLIDALKASVYFDDGLEPDSWLDDSKPSSGFEPGNVVTFKNGLLDFTTRELAPCTPRFFNLNYLPFDYDADAIAPTAWLKFLKDLWKDDHESIALLQEFFGYVLSGRTNLERYLLIVGPPRSGKSTITTVLSDLVGSENVVAKSLTELAGSSFGLQAYIGKTLAIPSEFRITGKDKPQILEKFLGIIGNDQQTINRKYREDWTGQLGVRFVITTNEIPDMRENSSALAQRTLLLKTTESFFGREDPQLKKKLVEELPGILRWALEGLDRLLEREHFTTVRSSARDLQEMAELSSPTLSFFREMLVEEEGAKVGVDEIFEAYQMWCAENGQGYVERKQVFGRNVKAQFPNVKVTQRKSKGVVSRCYVGWRFLNSGTGRSSLKIT